MTFATSLVNPTSQTPDLRRRLACFLYESVLLFGVVMIAGYLFSSLSQQRNALQGRLGLQIFIFLVLGIYFVWFWSHGGQTLAMKTWHIKLVANNGESVSQTRALFRYLLSWLWFIPALVLIYIANFHQLSTMFAIMIAGVFAYAGLVWLRPDRQYLHDVLCGTRLITLRPPIKNMANQTQE